MSNVALPMAKRLASGQAEHMARGRGADHGPPPAGLLGPGGTVLYGVAVVVSGVGLGAMLTMPSSMQADVIDYGELLTGSRVPCLCDAAAVAERLAGGAWSDPLARHGRTA